MRSEILLGGGGNEDQVAAINQYFARILKPTGPVLYVPWAFPPANWNACNEWFARMWSKCSNREAIMLTDPSEAPAAESLGGIYIGGGDTNLLINQIHANTFNQFLKLASDVDTPISGGSAGAIIFGKYLWTAPECRPLRITAGELDLLGLNWCDDLSIACHYSPHEDSTYERFTNCNQNAAIIAIPEDAAIAYSTSAIKVIGNTVVGYGHSKYELAEGTYAKQEVLNMLGVAPIG